jgi:hypothetical protein
MRPVFVDLAVFHDELDGLGDLNVGERVAGAPTMSASISGAILPRSVASINSALTVVAARSPGAASCRA